METTHHTNFVQTGYQLWDPCSTNGKFTKHDRKLVYTINCFWRDWEKEWKPYARNAAVFHAVAFAHQVLQAEYMHFRRGVHAALCDTRYRMKKMIEAGELRADGEPMEDWKPCPSVL